MGGAAAYAGQPGHQTAMAIRVGGLGPANPVAAPPPETPAVAQGPISLYELVRQVRGGATSTTTTTATTAGKASAPTTTTTTSTAPVGQVAAGVGPTTTSTTPLTPLTTLLQQLAPALGALTGSDSGLASWFFAPAGTCAHRDLPLGTVVKVIRISTGASATCRVSDRGPTLATKRVIDLSPDTFEKLASKDAGVIDVRLEW
jgi:rare lipoprotein A (peptidoglycan hydrolase)